MPPLRERCVPLFLASNDLVKGPREGRVRLSGPLPAGSDILGTNSHNNNNICVLFTGLAETVSRTLVNALDRIVFDVFLHSRS
jgi:hypothetical protein